jgi:hypothetical protein
LPSSDPLTFLRDLLTLAERYSRGAARGTD